MIKLIDKGRYALVETYSHTKILRLGKSKYAWIDTSKGELLVKTKRAYRGSLTLSARQYRLYEVENERDLPNALHLELNTGNGKWQAYILPSGLPNESKPRAPMLPRARSITVSPKSRSELLKA